MTAREVGEWLGVSTETVLRRYRRGELPGYRIASNALRFDEAELAEWLDVRRGGNVPRAKLAAWLEERRGGPLRPETDEAVAALAPRREVP